MIEPREAEKLVYDWCTRVSRGTTSARALAAIYASAYMDHVPLLRFMDLRTLDDVRLEWALSLIEGYVEGELADFLATCGGAGGALRFDSTGDLTRLTRQMPETLRWLRLFRPTEQL